MTVSKKKVPKHTPLILRNRQFAKGLKWWNLCKFVVFASNLNDLTRKKRKLYRHPTIQSMLTLIINMQSKSWETSQKQLIKCGFQSYIASVLAFVTNEKAIWSIPQFIFPLCNLLNIRSRFAYVSLSIVCVWWSLASERRNNPFVARKGRPKTKLPNVKKARAVQRYICGAHYFGRGN